MDYVVQRLPMHRSTATPIKFIDIANRHSALPVKSFSPIRYYVPPAPAAILQRKASGSVSWGRALSKTIDKS